MKPDKYTGIKTQDGVKIHDGDLVDAIAFGERVTDRVHYSDDAWRFGGYDGILTDFVLIRVAGNISKNPWPLNQEV